MMQVVSAVESASHWQTKSDLDLKTAVPVAAIACEWMPGLVVAVMTAVILGPVGALVGTAQLGA
jgi:hypothetical protein